MGSINRPSTSFQLKSINEEGLATIFARLSEKRILLDVEGAGTPEMMQCCHGGCDNCDFSRIFDEMKSGRPKWIPTYSFREHIDGRKHVPSWTSDLFDSNDENEFLTNDVFVERLCALSSKMCMGPSSAAAKTPLDEDSAHYFYNLLIKETQAKDGLSMKTMADALSTLTSNNDGVLWKDFKECFLALVTADEELQLSDV